jgi:ABC-2 type transport system ATP-binding protein
VDTPALEAFGVSKQYGGRDALLEIDFVAAPGSVHALLGPNGAGKTTLLRILLGLIRRDAGTVRLLGHDLDDSGGPIPPRVAGFVETPAFYPYLSGRKNLELLARLDGGQRHTDGVAALLGLVGLAEDGERRAATYSTGMRQRLGVAAALLRSPELLLLDEPTSGLDPAGAADMRSLFRRLAARGTAVVLSSHDMTEVEGLSDEVTVIDRGRVTFSGRVDELRGSTPETTYVLRTSDDLAAVDLSSRYPDVRVAISKDGLEVSGSEAALDAYVIALGCSGIAVRSLECHERSLESLFLQLTYRSTPEARSLPPA